VRERGRDSDSPLIAGLIYTPMAQSGEYYAALKMRGVPANLMRFDSEYHGTGSKPSNAMRTML